MRKMVLLALVSVVLLSMVCGCTDPNPYRGVADELGDIAGFSQGLWHGVIVIPMLIVDIFMDVNIYDVHNNGWRYNLGFYLGIYFIWLVAKVVLFFSH